MDNEINTDELCENSPEITGGNEEVQIMSIDDIYSSIEAILFASGESVSYAKLSAVLEVPMWQLLNIMRDFKEKYNESHGGVQLILLEQSAQLCTRAEYADIIKKALADRNKGQLSKAAFEVLSIIAYKQPATKAYIEQVRGVESGNTVNLLCEKGLVECCGRLDVPGRPFTYRTTDNFLRCFGLSSTDDLPPIETFAEDLPDEDDLTEDSPKILDIDEENTSDNAEEKQ